MAKISQSSYSLLLIVALPALVVALLLGLSLSSTALAQSNQIEYAEKLRDDISAKADDYKKASMKVEDAKELLNLAVATRDAIKTTVDDLIEQVAAIDREIDALLAAPVPGEKALRESIAALEGAISRKSEDITVCERRAGDCASLYDDLELDESLLAEDRKNSMIYSATETRRKKN